MKKLICALLVPVLLAQAVGCYSSKEIELPELDQYKNDKLYLTTKDSSEYILLNGSNNPNISNWELVNDSLVLSTDRLLPYSQNEEMVVKEHVAIPFSSINNLKVYEFNLATTSLLIIGILGACVGLIAANFEFEM